MKAKQRHPLIVGTFILTATGIVSRIIGFLYRIYLSRLFGEEGMGIYQLLSPVLSLSFSLTAAGYQTAISKLVAEQAATSKKPSLRPLVLGLLVSLPLSLACNAVLFLFADQVSASLLQEPRTASMLRILSFSVPLSAVHSCINGYFYGIRKAGIPAFSQLAEQVCRVGSVYLIYFICQKHGLTPTISFAVVGLVIGESASMIVSVVAILARAHQVFPAGGSVSVHTPSGFPAGQTHASLFFRHRRTARPLSSVITIYRRITGQLLQLAVPLSANRLVLNLLQSVEAIYIPNRLMAYGLSNAEALSVYGVLTGMSLPLILFPSAITNSVSVLLLPIVSEADAGGNQNAVRRAIFTSIRLCLLLGFFCTALFLLFGRPVGRLLFHSELAGSFILTLSFLCPFMYIASMLNSILNGLGKTIRTFLYSVASLLFRLLFVFFAIPRYGIQGYLWGMLASQMLQTLLCTVSALHVTRQLHAPFKKGTL